MAQIDLLMLDMPNIPDDSVPEGKDESENVIIKEYGKITSTNELDHLEIATDIDTDLASKLLRNDKMVENIKQRHPLKKYLNPKEVADMAEFLISSKSSSISGQIFEMDCGIVSFKI